MADDPSFDDVMARLGGGDPAAAAEVFARFTSRLIVLAQTRLDARLRQKVDPDDVLQSVHKSFFRCYGGGKFVLGGWDGLWTLLDVITVRKCADLAAYFHAEKRDIDREATPPAAEGNSGVSWAILARDPTPSEAAVLEETVERLLRGLEGRNRDIVSLAPGLHRSGDQPAAKPPPAHSLTRPGAGA
jgi:RNA polymerase sigma-70 factor (ECF subfamily)